MPMRGNVMCDISCHQHHDELFVCQCVLQPAIPVCVCVCVCVCVQRARQCRQQEEEYTRPKKEKKREHVWVCEEEERETASQMNEPTNQVKQATSVRV